MICLSQYSASAAVDVLGLDPERISVVPPGVNEMFVPPNDRQRADPPFVLLVGEYAPQKDWQAAFQVVSQLADRGYPHRLKVAGRIAPWLQAEVDQMRRAAGSDSIDILGYVPDSVLVQLYHAASAAILTSRFEGFGLPALEAMATGLPLVAFRNTSIPEVVGSGGVLVADGDVDAMVDELSSILDERELWASLSERALAQAAKFSWPDAAARHARLFAQVAGA